MFGMKRTGVSSIIIAVLGLICIGGGVRRDWQASQRSFQLDEYVLILGDAKQTNSEEESLAGRSTYLYGFMERWYLAPTETWGPEPHLRFPVTLLDSLVAAGVVDGICTFEPGDVQCSMSMGRILVQATAGRSRKDGKTAYQVRTAATVIEEGRQTGYSLRVEYIVGRRNGRPYIVSKETVLVGQQ